MKWTLPSHATKFAPPGCRLLNPLQIAQSALRIFGEGAKVCVECTVMAADAGAVSDRQDCIAIARPADPSKYAPTALVLRPARSKDIFNVQVKEMLQVPAQERLAALTAARRPG